MDSIFEGAFGADLEEEADICIFICPHLNDFLIVDARLDIDGSQRVKLFNVREAFNEGFYSKIEKAFSTLLRDTDQPFANMMELPSLVEDEIRQQGLEAILKLINENLQLEEAPRVAILLATTSVFSLSSDQLNNAFTRLLRSDVKEACIEDSVRAVETLIAREKEIVHALQQGRLRDLIRGESPDYFTIWESNG